MYWLPDIREELLEAGYDPSFVYGLDDEALVTVWKMKNRLEV